MQPGAWTHADGRGAFRRRADRDQHSSRLFAYEHIDRDGHDRDFRQSQPDIDTSAGADILAGPQCECDAGAFRRRLAHTHGRLERHTRDHFSHRYTHSFLDSDALTDRGVPGKSDSFANATSCANREAARFEQYLDRRGQYGLVQHEQLELGIGSRFVR